MILIVPLKHRSPSAKYLRSKIEGSAVNGARELAELANVTETYVHYMLNFSTNNDQIAYLVKVLDESTYKKNPKTTWDDGVHLTIRMKKELKDRLRSRVKSMNGFVVDKFLEYYEENYED